VKRPQVILVAVLLVVMGGVGFWMVAQGETEEDRVAQAFEALKGAVETRDPDLLERYLHPQYSGWGGTRDSAVDLFRRAIDSYSNARIQIREQTIRINPEGNEAVMEFEWTYRATIRSDIQSVTREQMDRLPSGMMPWEDATAVFRREANAPWTLQSIKTQIPQFRR